MKQRYKNRSSPLALAGACIAVACAASSVPADAAVANATSHQLADPVIEEPLRPLLPDRQPLERVAPASCGTADVIPFAALSFLGFRLVSIRRRRIHTLPPTRTDRSPCP